MIAERERQLAKLAACVCPACRVDLFRPDKRCTCYHPVRRCPECARCRYHCECERSRVPLGKPVTGKR